MHHDTDILFLLLWRDDTQLEQVGKAVDGIERRAQLVRHIGQEYGLLPSGVLRLLRLFAQFLLHLLERRDVHRNAEDTDVAPQIVVVRRIVHL